jgi:hypothetical protein
VVCLVTFSHYQFEGLTLGDQLISKGDMVFAWQQDIVFNDQQAKIFFSTCSLIQDFFLAHIACKKCTFCT